VQPTHPSTVAWRKSSYSSGGGNDNCVELSGSLDAVRDSKNGAVLPLDTRSVAALLALARR
jgi:hypothetical protein